MVKVRPRWNDQTPYKVFKYDVNSKKEDIRMSFTELGELVNEFRRNKRNNDTERAVEWYVDTLIHFSAKNRAWLNPEVIQNMRPLAYESLFIPQKPEKVVVLTNPHKYCDVASGFIDLKLLQAMWSFRRSPLYVYHLALYLGNPPLVGVENTAVGLLGDKHLPKHIRYMSYLYWQARREGLLPFDQTVLSFKNAGTRGRKTSTVRAEYLEIYRYVEFMLNLEYPNEYRE